MGDASNSFVPFATMPGASRGRAVGSDTGRVYKNMDVQTTPSALCHPQSKQEENTIVCFSYHMKASSQLHRLLQI